MDGTLGRVVGLAIALVAACALAAPVLAAPGGSVTIAGHAFQPQELTVAAGTTVTWRNEDNETHNAVAFDGSFRTEVLAPGDSGSATFATAGSYSYRCTIHPSMRGAVTVLAAAAPPTDVRSEPASNHGGLPGPTIVLAAAAVLGAVVFTSRARPRKLR